TRNVCYGPKADIDDRQATSTANARRQVAKGTDPVRDPTHHDSNGGRPDNRESQIDANDTDRTSFGSRMHCAEV
ncbi:MAG: hypothetical protein WCD64_19470, partial [Pseudolabrys sp.]